MRLQRLLLVRDSAKDNCRRACTRNRCARRSHAAPLRPRPGRAPWPGPPAPPWPRESLPAGPACCCRSKADSGLLLEVSESPTRSLAVIAGVVAGETVVGARFAAGPRVPSAGNTNLGVWPERNAVLTSSVQPALSAGVLRNSTGFCLAGATRDPAAKPDSAQAAAKGQKASIPMQAFGAALADAQAGRQEALLRETRPTNPATTTARDRPCL